MSVNSFFTGFFTNRLVMRCGIAMVMPVIFLIASAFTEHSDRDLRATQVNLIIRQIGHRLLLQAGDMTSRVLPVTEMKSGTFVLQFENEFAFNHDSLMALTENWLPKTQFPSGYTVAVHECVKAAIVYGFQVSNFSRDILPCKGRGEARGCYKIEFTFPDFYKTEQEKADVQLLMKRKSPKVDPRKAKDSDINQLTAEVKPVEIDSQQADPKPEEFKTTASGFPFINLVNSGMLVLLGAGVTLLIGRFGKILTPGHIQKQSTTVLKESVTELPALGKFLFDAKDQRLLLEDEIISLTDKECRILELLNKNFGELITRETLIQEVWINEGVITGRSLDMFVSKLRKKLSPDPELRITNVHGKGYKLEIPGI